MVLLAPEGRLGVLPILLDVHTTHGEGWAVTATVHSLYRLVSTGEEGMDEMEGILPCTGVTLQSQIRGLLKGVLSPEGVEALPTLLPPGPLDIGLALATWTRTFTWGNPNPHPRQGVGWPGSWAPAQVAVQVLPFWQVE